MYFLQPSQKRLLSSLNPLILSAVVLVFVVVRTAMLPLLPSMLRQWDILLPFVVYFGQRRSLGEGLILTLFTSHLYSLCSAAPIGVFATHYLVLFLLVRGLSYGIYASTWLSISLLMLALAFLSRLSLTAVAALFGHGWSLFSFSNLSLGAIFLNAWMGFLLFALLEITDKLTFKSAPINIELSESAI